MSFWFTLCFGIILGVGGGESGEEGSQKLEKSPSSGPITKSFSSDVGVTVSLQLVNTLFLDNQPIPLCLSVHNDTNGNVPLVFPTLQRYDFYITDTQKQEIWRWSRCQSFPCMFVIYQMAPGEQLSYTTTWDQLDQNGKPVSPGFYYVYGVVSQNPEIATPAAIITIVARPKPLTGRWGPEVVVPTKRKPRP
jgi:hypothetical protein